MLTNIDIDEAVVAEAMRLTGARSKREIVDRALRELVARASRPSIRDLFGLGGVDPGYDPKAVDAQAGELGRFRVEEPQVVYTRTGQARGSTRKAPAKASRRAPAPGAKNRRQPGI